MTTEADYRLLYPEGQQECTLRPDYDGNDLAAPPGDLRWAAQRIISLEWAGRMVRGREGAGKRRITSTVCLATGSPAQPGLLSPSRSLSCSGTNRQIHRLINE